MTLVNFYNTNDVANKLNKTIDFIVGKNCEIKSNFDDSNIILKLSVKVNANYCQIKNLFYFVTWEYSNNFYYATCTIDVLMSYKDTINNSFQLLTMSNQNQNYVNQNLVLPSKKIVKGSKLNTLFTTPSVNSKIYLIGVK